MRFFVGLVLIVLVIGGAVGGWAVYSGRGEFMPESVKAAATKAVSAAGNAVSAKKPSEKGKEGENGAEKTEKPDPSLGERSENTRVKDTDPEGTAKRISLPRALRDLEWSMNRAEVTQLYPIGRKTTDHGEPILTHYRDTDHEHAIEFRFRNDQLIEVEMQIPTAEGETVDELYETLKGHYSSKYRHFAESNTKWTDGRISVRMFSMQDKVYVRFQRVVEQTAPNRNQRETR